MVVACHHYPNIYNVSAATKWIPSGIKTWASSGANLLRNETHHFGVAEKRIKINAHFATNMRFYRSKHCQTHKDKLSFVTQCTRNSIEELGMQVDKDFYGRWLFNSAFRCGWELGCSVTLAFLENKSVQWNLFKSTLSLIINLIL